MIKKENVEKKKHSNKGRKPTWINQIVIVTNYYVGCFIHSVGFDFEMFFVKTGDKYIITVVC